MRKTVLVCVALLLSLPLALRGQEDLDKRKPPRPKPDCLDGTVYDDGKLESGLRSVLFSDNFVMLIEAPSYPAKLEKVCIAWVRTSFWTSVFFDLRIWAAVGNSETGTLLIHPRALGGRSSNESKILFL